MLCACRAAENAYPTGRQSPVPEIGRLR
jgi:hypothetical protein